MATGRTFGGRRNIGHALGYKDVLIADDFLIRFRRNEVANRVVKALPNATWRGGAEIWEDQDPNVDTPFEEAFIALDQRIHIWDTFRKADVLSRIGRYGCIVIGAPGELDVPLVSCGPDEIAYLRGYGEWDAIPIQYETDRKNVRFGLPVFYQINRTSVTATGAVAMNSPTVSNRVHYTRIHHMSDGLLEDSLFGEPALQCVWNRLDDLDKVAGGGAEAFWRRADQGTQFDIDETQDVSPEAKAAFESQIADYEHGLKRYLLTRGVKAATLGSDVADFSSPVTSIISLICAGTGIPQRVFTGSEQGKLAAKTDRGNWDDRVADRREAYAEPLVVRPFIDKLIGLGALPKPAQPYEIRFPELKILDDVQRAEVANQWAGLNKPNEPLVVSRNEIRQRVLGLPTWEESNPDDDGMPVPQKNPLGLVAGREGAPAVQRTRKAADRFRTGDARDRRRRFFGGQA